MSFYVTLPSDASMDVCPNNTQSNFTTYLQKPLEVRDYKVGLAEIGYSTNIKIRVGTIRLKIYEKEDWRYILDIYLQPNAKINDLIKEI